MFSGAHAFSASTRADFTKVVGTTIATTLAVAAPALAKPGTAPKQNLFGVIGSDMNLGGGASNYFPESDTYSPYSPYGDGKDALYNKDDGSFMLKVKLDVLKDSQKRIQAIPAFIEKKQWSEIRSTLTSKVRTEAIQRVVWCLPGLVLLQAPVQVPSPL